MGVACITAGVLSCIMSTFMRALVQTDALPPKGQFSKLFGIPLRENRELLLGSIGQLLGILWIAVGIFLIRVDEWLSSSLVGIISEPFIAFSPLIIGGVLLRLLTYHASGK